MIVSKSITNHFALFVYPWENRYPDESDPTGNLKSGDPIILTSHDMNQGSGITFLQMSRSKNIGGSLVVDHM